MTIAPKIFREYDIRGVWGKDLSPESVSAIGRAFAWYLKKNLSKDALTVTVGRDVRLSSPAMFDHLAEGLTTSGIDVVDIGSCPTPLQYFSLYHLNVDGGIMITGSHNPPEFNGMKLSMGKDTLYGKSIQELKRIIEAGEGTEGSGDLRTYDIIPAYTDHLRKLFGRFERIKVVVDAGNGTGGLVAPSLLRFLGCEVTELYCEPDGTFPNHHPDPVVPENVLDLIAKVKSEKAHLGIGYDGDSDRIGVVDEDGEIVWGDRLMVIFARDILEQNPGATVIGEVKCSQTLFDDIKEHGGNPIMWKVGHSLIKSKMKETSALLAGEMSGHLFFADRYFGYDDAIYASLRLIEILSRRGKPYSLKGLLSGVPSTVSTPEIRLDCPDELKFMVMEKAKAEFCDYPLFDIDGIRINFGKGWGLIRASNTQPALVMRFEAEDRESLEKIQRLVEERLKNFF
ncbi:MAG TPA: phosphomannomutase/phosphoglucomutase [Thermodesulfovibrionales bacterium]|jgi:phosphomannomutase/phosphoglucomutase|nr:phosphomannomutase/phosphoglucomutase [Thermodesulfovibrionales bacterium]